MSTEDTKVRRRKYRTSADTKNLKQLNVRVSNTTLDLIEFNRYDEKGRKLSKDKVVEDMIAFAAPRMMKTRNL